MLPLSLSTTLSARAPRTDGSLSGFACAKQHTLQEPQITRLPDASRLSTGAIASLPRLASRAECFRPRQAKACTRVTVTARSVSVGVHDSETRSLPPLVKQRRNNDDCETNTCELRPPLRCYAHAATRVGAHSDERHCQHDCQCGSVQGVGHETAAAVYIPVPQRIADVRMAPCDRIVWRTLAT